MFARRGVCLGHVPAVNVPLKELEERLKELPHEQEIVAYCRGALRTRFRGVARLREQGFQRDGWRTDFRSGAKRDCPSRKAL